VQDSVLHKLQANGGLIMICFIPSLVTPQQQHQHRAENGSNGSSSDKKAGGGPSVASVVDSIMHVGATIGYAHVGIGSDFDGMLEGPPDLDDTSCFPGLVEEMLRRGVEEEDVKGVMGLNLIRVMREVEAVSEAGKGVDCGVGGVLCDDIVSPWTEEQVKLLVARGSLRATE
jgi:membrane dipeptidase